MLDKELLRKALTAVSIHFGINGCGGCPYYMEKHGGCSQRLILDVDELLEQLNEQDIEQRIPHD